MGVAESGSEAERSGQAFDWGIVECWLHLEKRRPRPTPMRGEHLDIVMITQRKQESKVEKGPGGERHPR